VGEGMSVFTIKILGHEYKEELDENLVLERNTAGSCCPGTLKITLCPHVPQSRRDEARVHEIFEALKYHLGINLTHDHLTALSEAWYQVLKNNPHLFKY
jgi:hypothetical protein